MKSVIKSLALVLALGAAQTAQATPIVLQATLTGGLEVPPNASPGTGTATVTIDSVANTMLVSLIFSGLDGTTAASHIHCCLGSPFQTGTNAGVATQTPTFAMFPLGVTSGTYNHLFDMTLASSYNSAFITANGGTTSSAEAALFAGMLAGESYLNIHTNTFANGEIRGFLIPVPEPITLSIFGVGLVGMAALRRRKAKKG